MRLRVYDESTSVVDECHKHLHVEQTDNFVNLLNLVRSAPARDNAEDYYERKDRRETEASVEREMSDSLVIVQTPLFTYLLTFPFARAIYSRT